MRIGIIPLYYVSPKLFGISAVNGMVDLAKGILEQYEDAHVYFYLMDVFEYSDSDFDKRLGSVRSRFTIRKHPPFAKNRFNWLRDSVLMHEELYRMLSSKTGDCLDVVLNGLIFAGFTLKSCLEDSGVRTLRDSPVMVAWHNDVIHPIKEGQFTVDEMRVRGSVGSLLQHDFNQFFIPYEVDLMTEIARKYVSMSEIKRMLDNKIVEPMGIDFTLIDSVVSANKKKRKDPGEVIRFFYGGSFAPKKRMPEMLSIVKNLFRAGKNVKFTITSQMSSLPENSELSDEDVKSYCEINFGCDRMKFIQKMGEADVFFCFTKNESMGLAYFEMLYSGMIGVFLDRPWLKGLLPKGYPFLARTINEAETMAKDIAGDYNSAREKLNAIDVQGFLNEKFGYRKVARRWYEAVQKEVDARTKACGKSWISRLITDNIEKYDKDEFDMHYVYQMIQKYSDKNINIEARNDIATVSFVRKCVLATGKVYDTGAESDPTFKRIV